MTTETQQKLIGVLASIALVALGVGAYVYGAHELGALIVGGALGHAMPARAVRNGDSLRPPPASPRAGFFKPEVLAVIVLFAGVIAGIALWLSGCGATPQQRAAYAAEVERCQANEDAIRARPGTTHEEDTEATELERERCAAALRAIEEGR